ncbi:MAG: metal-dependent hydrolase, partial [Maribacter sp.]
IRPTPFNTILWTANVDTEDSYLIGNYSFFDSESIKFKAYPKNRNLLGDLQSNEKMNRLINIAEGWYTLTENEGKLYFNDLRFGLVSLSSNEEKFAFSYRLISKDKDLTVEETPKFQRDAARLFTELWKRMWGN